MLGVVSSLAVSGVIPLLEAHVSIARGSGYL